jgi:protocatechuate 3,4-dioxygenase alpha subunit
MTRDVLKGAGMTRDVLKGPGMTRDVLRGAGMSEHEPLVATPSQTVGPFFHFGLTEKPMGRLVDRLPPGAQITVVITVTDGDQQPVADAVIELSQDGVFGRMHTGPDGTCEFLTVRPASHVTVCLFARGLLRQLHTRIYFPGDGAAPRDDVLALIPEHRRRTLMASADPADPSIWRFHIRMQGHEETVFFDL